MRDPGPIDPNAPRACPRGPCTKDQEVAKLAQLTAILREDGYYYLADIFTATGPDIVNAIRNDLGFILGPTITERAEKFLADERAAQARLRDLRDQEEKIRGKMVKYENALQAAERGLRKIRDAIQILV